MQRLVFAIIIIMCICIGVLFQRVAVIGALNSLPPKQKKIIYPNIEMTDYLKRNCDEELIYATNDQQCARMCINKTDYLVINGICRNSKILLSNSSSAAAGNDKACDPKRGFLTYIVGNGMLGNAKLLCLSVDPGIQADDARQANRFCAGGKFKQDAQLDYLKQLPKLSDCLCNNSSGSGDSDDDLLVVIPSTSYIRQYGICINKRLAKII